MIIYIKLLIGVITYNNWKKQERRVCAYTTIQWAWVGG